jgi:hypothetical protein
MTMTQRAKSECLSEYFQADDVPFLDLGCIDWLFTVLVALADLASTI